MTRTEVDKFRELWKKYEETEDDWYDLAITSKWRQEQVRENLTNAKDCVIDFIKRHDVINTLYAGAEVIEEIKDGPIHIAK